MVNFYNKTVAEALDNFRTDPKTGLSSAEVARRQAKYGKNTLNVKGTPLWRKIIEPFCDVFMLILVAALIISIIQQSWTEVAMIGLDMVLDATVFYIQDVSTERILRNLRKQTVQKITVLRNGEETSMLADELVPGDIVILSEGDRIPADGRIIVESGLLTNESMLTGESDSIAKDAKAISGIKKIYEQRNMVFSGSFVITGSAKMLVTATGNNTEYGHIASLASSAENTSPIQEKINKLVVYIAIIIMILAVIVLIVQIFNGIELLSAFEFTLAMIVSAVPEDLPIATAIILALGARRMAKKNALIKELRAIESIGIVTTIASDKTGTLTENHLSVTGTWAVSDKSDILKSIANATLAPANSPDPLDTCLQNYIMTKKPHYIDISPAHSYAFDQDVKLSGNLFQTKTGALQLVVKGAPETILAKAKISNAARVDAEAKLAEFTNHGYKVIAIANANLKHEINELNKLSKSDEFTLIGLVAVADAIRPEAKAAIKTAATAGVKVKMVTGDHAGTAFAIGRELGIVKEFSEVLDCSKLGNITDEDLSIKVQNVSVFARVTPEDKYRILSAIKQTEVVAMTGDGVNDVPAITNAHIGIAMGNGPSIVQDAGDIVLLDNNFKSITDAMTEGRLVLTNIRRMLVYLLATNAGEALTMLGALVFGGGQLLLPVQILWVNMVTDSMMIIPIGLEPSERYIMRQKPEAKDVPILSKLLVLRMILISITMAAITLTTYFVSAAFLTHEQARTLAFVALVAMQWANALTIRGIYESVFARLKVRHPFFWTMLILAVIIQIVTIFTPLANFVGVVAVPPFALALVIFLSFIIPIITVEIHKKCCK